MPRGQHHKSKTHCPSGHPYSGDNLILSNEGRNRHCRECKNSKARVRNLKPCTHCGVPTSKIKYCSECAPDKKSYARLVAYGVDAKMWDAMYFEQNGTCGLCLEAEAVDTDHCHITGKARKLLCRKCNIGLHYLDNSEWLELASKYKEETSWL